MSHEHEHEAEAKELMRKFKIQHEQNIGNVNTGSNPDQTPEAEVIIQQINTVQSVPSTVPSTQQNVCPQCKTIHPPLRPGESCPNASQDISEYGLIDGDINKHLIELRNIVMSQMNKKQIKDGKKFFQFAIIELMKALEGYNE